MCLGMHIHVAVCRHVKATRTNVLYSWDLPGVSRANCSRANKTFHGAIKCTYREATGGTLGLLLRWETTFGLFCKRYTYGNDIDYFLTCSSFDKNKRPDQELFWNVMPWSNKLERTDSLSTEWNCFCKYITSELSSRMIPPSSVKYHGSLTVCVFSLLFLLWPVCALEGVPVPLVRQKCRVEQNLHSTLWSVWAVLFVHA